MRSRLEWWNVGRVRGAARRAEGARLDSSLVGVEHGVVDGGGDVLDVGLRDAAHVDAPARHGVHVVVLADEVHLPGCSAKNASDELYSV